MCQLRQSHARLMSPTQITASMTSRGKLRETETTGREKLQGAIWNKRLWRLSDIRISVESRSGVHVTYLITVRCSGFNYMIIFALRVPSPPWASGLPVPFWTGRPHFIIFSFVRVFPLSFLVCLFFFPLFFFIKRRVCPPWQDWTFFWLFFSNTYSIIYYNNLLIILIRVNSRRRKG